MIMIMTGSLPFPLCFLPHPVFGQIPFISEWRKTEHCLKIEGPGYVGKLVYKESPQLLSSCPPGPCGQPLGLAPGTSRGKCGQLLGFCHQTPISTSLGGQTANLLGGITSLGFLAHVLQWGGDFTPALEIQA